MVTSKDVARLANVSQSTVSYVMNGSASISEKTRQRVLAAMKELHYYPNVGARALAGRRAGAIGLAVEITRRTQIPEMLPYVQAITGLARQRNYDVVLSTEDMGPDKLRKLVFSGIIDALVMMDIEYHDRRIPVAQRLPIPVVPIGAPEDPGTLRCVVVDNVKVGEMAVRELSDVGARRIVVIGDPRGDGREFSFIADSERGCMDAARGSGVPLSVFHPDDAGWKGVLPLIRDMESWKGAGVGLFCRSPRISQWMMEAMMTLRLRPGADVALVGECPDSFAEDMPVAMTNVSPSEERICERVMSLLFDLMNGGSVEGGVDRIAPVLTRRDTTVPGFASR